MVIYGLIFLLSDLALCVESEMTLSWKEEIENETKEFNIEKRDMKEGKNTVCIRTLDLLLAR